jgi:hypothetical protein
MSDLIRNPDPAGRFINHQHRAHAAVAHVFGSFPHGDVGQPRCGLPRPCSGKETRPTLRWVK